MYAGADPERTPVRTALWGMEPSPQDAFTLRAAMAEHQATTQHLDRLRTRQAADAAAAADAGTAAGRLGNAARVEATRTEIEAMEARQAEIRAELAQAHARATGHPAAGSVEAARAELGTAQQAERTAREGVEMLRARPRRLHAERARHLRVYALLVAVLGIAVAVTAALDWRASSVVCAVLLAPPVLGAVLRVCRTAELIAADRAALPAAVAMHDAALRRLVAAEAGALAGGLDLVPSTLDADVERTAGTSPTTW